MAVYIPRALREQVRRRAQQRCEYCQSAEWLVGMRHECDHILPRHMGGSSTAENLCLACSSCNSHKQARIEAVDPETTEIVPLYDPRRHHWQEHFAWRDDGTRITGLTSIGRATVETLQMNHSTVVTARSLWVETGHHPPG
jgi:hypothetical protein